MGAIRVAVVGAGGRMGKTVVSALEQAPDMEISQLIGVHDDIHAITSENTDVAVEFTLPGATLANVLALIAQGVNVVVGTSGWSDDMLAKARQALLQAQVAAPSRKQSVCIVPNFAISAVLAQVFAAKAAAYFESVEVIEMHHPDKIDAPSGTAVQTARAIAQARKAAGAKPMPDATQVDGGSRGQVVDGVHVHAVRLRGLSAHQEVLLGNPGEELTLRSDSFDRQSYQPGILMAIRAMQRGQFVGLTVGLDKLMAL